MLVLLCGVAAALLLAGASGCSALGYYAQSVQGHLALLTQAKPVDNWLADPATPPALHQRLLLAQRMRRFAATDLALPDNASYHRYADLHRTAVVWNVVAAPELSLTLKTWCYPLMGCVGYRGYFDREAAQREAASLSGEGLDVSVYGVPAYSTLGWSNWLGGDPLLNTFVNGTESGLARLIFHELAHQVVYASDDTMFNESFATAVARLGLARWQAAHGGAADGGTQARRQADFRALAFQTREALQALYASGAPEAEQRAGKQRLLAEMRARYAALKAGPWAGYAGYDAWFASANNAALALQAAYDRLVPAFERLFHQQGGDFKRFYAEVARLAALPKDQRRATLDALMAAAPVLSAASSTTPSAPR